MKICTYCVLDETVPDIQFDVEGVCNICKEYRKNLPLRLAVESERDEILGNIVKKIKTRGNGKEYDCLIGVSGGVDSTFIAYKVKELGLNPLAVHLDNGWNSELSVINIENIIKNLNIDLETYVLDWEEFKDLQKSFLNASTPDGEIPTDHAILAILYKMANKYDIKYIITGYNYSEEGLMPKYWAYGHIDWKYIKNVHTTFGRGKLKTYPHITIHQLAYYTFFKRIKKISLLNYFNYNRNDAENIIKEKLGWKPYGWKHHESIYTRFYQGYILMKKFGIDKRKAHLSNLICSGKTTRQDALIELKHDAYFEHRLMTDMDFVTKKLGYTKSEFDKVLKLPTNSFRDYINSYKFNKFIKVLINFLRTIKLLYK